MSLARRLLLTVAPETPLIVAVSGGADSIALLHLLRSRLTQLHVVTIDHGLRGSAGTEDAEFVRVTAEAWGLTVTVGSLHLDPHAPRLETRARHARYAFLATTARSHGITHIATAHHANDQAETVLMHLIRGTGLHGLGGMKPRAPLPHHPDLTLLRPLLQITRTEIEAYCAEHHLPYRHDETNDQTHTLRNRIRLALLPQLAELNVRIVPTLVRTAEVIALEDAWIESSLQQAISGQVKHAADVIDLPLTTYAGLHPVLQRRFILWAAQQLGVITIDHADVTRALTQLERPKVGKTVLLAGGLQLRVNYDTLSIGRKVSMTVIGLPKHTEIPLQIGQNVVTTRESLVLSRDPMPEGVRITAPIDAVITLRTRRSGDHFYWHRHQRKLTDWMIDHKIERELRDQLPVIAVGKAIKAVLLPSGWVIADPIDDEVDWYLFMSSLR
ncbi:MAG: tRNA lysidine(34) synthetase TilS [Anaerolineae bacterium]|nr:tRNA lysidine(34) synthetase TilS [Anaerolineae bacterium]